MYAYVCVYVGCVCVCERECVCVRERETYVGLMSRVVGAKCADPLSTGKVMESVPLK